MSQTTTTKRIDFSALPFPCQSREQGGTWTITADVPQSTLNDAIAAAATAPEPSTLESNRVSLRSEAKDAFPGLKSIVNSTGTLTGAQLSNAVRLIARCIIILGRLALDLYESTGNDAPLANQQLRVGLVGRASRMASDVSDAAKSTVGLTRKSPAPHVTIASLSPVDPDPIPTRPVRPTSPALSRLEWVFGAILLFTVLAVIVAVKVL